MKSLTRQYWIAIGFALFCVVLFGAMAFVSMQRASEAIHDEAEGRIESSATVSARYVAEQLRSLAELTDSFAQRTSLIGALGDGTPASYHVPALRRHLQQLAESRDGINAAGLATPDGDGGQIYPFDQRLIGRDFSTHDWYKGAIRNDAFYISGAIASSKQGHARIVVVSTPVRSEGKLLGILTVSLRTSATQDFIERFAKNQGVSLTVTDQYGVLVAQPEGAPDSLEPVKDIRVDNALKGRSGTIETTVDGERTLSAYQEIPELGWTMIASVPTKIAYEPIGDLRRILFVSAGVLLLLLVIALFILGRWLRLYERKLQRNIDELRSANQTLDAFSHTLVHDLRNPLTTIGGFADTLQRTLQDADEQAKVMMSHIQQSALRMDRLIQEVLDLATATRAEERDWVHPPDIVREAADTVQGIALQVGELPESVCANRAGLYRSIQNLLANAEHYATRGDRPPLVKVYGIETQTHWEISVEDDGPGVSLPDQAGIFKPFFRGADAAQTTPGTGLGLSIVAAFAQANGGSVKVENVPDGGARFTISMPKGEPRPRRSFTDDELVGSAQ